MVTAGNPRGDDGVIAVYFALLMVVLVGLASIVVDLGVAYANRRQMQNAADAASLAATQKLNDALFQSSGPDPADAEQVATLAAQTVADNGGSSGPSAVAAGLYSCTVVDANGGSIAACSDWTTWTDPSQQAVGVRVQAGRAVQTFFGGIFGVSSTTARTVAAARVEPLIAGSGPFLVCAFDQLPPGDGNGNGIGGGNAPASGGKHGSDGTEGSNGKDGKDGKSSGTQPDLLVKGTGGTWVTNGAAIGQAYELHGPQVSTCDIKDSSFKGLAADPAAPTTIVNSAGTQGAWFDTLPGDHAGPVRVQVAGQVCTNVDVIGCQFVTPICLNDGPHGHGRNAQLWCVAFGVFKISQAGANYHVATFEGSRPIAGGVGGAAVPSPGEPVLVKLFQ